MPGRHELLNQLQADTMDIAKARDFIDAAWSDSILPQLIEYVRIPNKSPLFDPDWEAHGHMEAAVQLMLRWAQAEAPPDSRIEVLRLPGRTPVLMVDVPGDVDDCVLMYGHLDKQPEFTGWSDGLDPWTPVLRDGKLYGRGGADDGYALFSSIAAIRALREQKIPHSRCVVLIEASEESGSPDLPAHIDALGARLGQPSLVVCLDAECGNYDQLWCTTSLRGNLIGTLRADVLTEAKTVSRTSPTCSSWCSWRRAAPASWPTAPKRRSTGRTTSRRCLPCARSQPATWAWKSSKNRTCRRLRRRS